MLQWKTLYIAVTYRIECVCVCLCVRVCVFGTMCARVGSQGGGGAEEESV